MQSRLDTPISKSVTIASFVAGCVVTSACLDPGGESEVERDAEVVLAVEPVAPTVTPSIASTLTTEELDAIGMPYEMLDGEPIFTVLEPDGIPAIDAPEFVRVEDAFEFMRAEETVLGVVGKSGTAKCYSAWQLDSHEIVNDVLDGVAIAATW